MGGFLTVLVGAFVERGGCISVPSRGYPGLVSVSSRGVSLSDFTTPAGGGFSARHTDRAGATSKLKTAKRGREPASKTHRLSVVAMLPSQPYIKTST